MKRLTLRLLLRGAILALMMKACSLTSSTSQPPVPSAPGIVTPPLDGAWEGTVNFPFRREKIVIQITTVDNDIEATLDIPRQDAEI